MLLFGSLFFFYPLNFKSLFSLNVKLCPFNFMCFWFVIFLTHLLFHDITMLFMTSDPFYLFMSCLPYWIWTLYHTFALFSFSQLCFLLNTLKREFLWQWAAEDLSVYFTSFGLCTQGYVIFPQSSILCLRLFLRFQVLHIS